MSVYDYDCCPLCGAEVKKVRFTGEVQEGLSMRDHLCTLLIENGGVGQPIVRFNQRVDCHYHNLQATDFGINAEAVRKTLTSLKKTGTLSNVHEGENGVVVEGNGRFQSVGVFEDTAFIPFVNRDLLEEVN
jgi:hypothetical protein